MSSLDFDPGLNEAVDFRLSVTHDIVIAHKSLGNFHETWKIYAGCFMAKFPGLPGERVSVGLTRASFANRKDAMDFVGRLRALCRFAASRQQPAGDDKPKPVTEC